MRRDACGVEGLPLQLLIVVIVIGITVPSVYAGLSASERQQLDLRVRDRIHRVVATAQAFYIAGGGADVVEVDLTGLLTVSVEYVRFGGTGGNASLVAFRLTGGAEHVVVTEPTVPMLGPNHGALALGPGLHRVRVEAADGLIRLSVA